MEKEKLKISAKILPKRPGVYLFRNTLRQVLYIGKALSLKNRVASYFLKTKDAKIAQMITQASVVDYIETGSEFAALVLEAKLISLYKPKYNFVFRDDRSFLYIFVSLGEDFPKVYLTRKPEPSKKKSKYEVYQGMKGKYFGPFPSSRSTKYVLKMTRKTIPFCQQKKIGKRPCFYSHIGLCDPCPAFIVKQEGQFFRVLKKQYRKNISRLVRLLQGRFDKVIGDLERDMIYFSDNLRFERAQKIHTKLRSLKLLLHQTSTTSLFLENPNHYFDTQIKAINELEDILNRSQLKVTKLSRIECFDISTLLGEQSVGSQVVFVNGVPEKSDYKRYLIRKVGKQNDVAMMREVLLRRLKHKDWTYPDLIVVDGGKPQVAAVYRLLTEKDLDIPVIGLAKRLERIVVPESGKFRQIILPRSSLALRLLQAVRDEAHRFALDYHRKRRKRDFLTTKG